MTYTRLPDDLPARLRAAGLTVIEINGWKTRGRPASKGEFKPVGFLNHHTGASAAGWTANECKAYASSLALVGRPDLEPPLCHLALDPAGRVYVIASGRANHAGVAKPAGTVAGGDGNALYVGMEWMLSGLEPIPTVMYDAGATVNAVLLHEVLHTSVRTVHCHYETSVTGKWDIGDPNGIPFKGRRVLDVAKFQTRVQTRLSALYPPPPVKTTVPPPLPTGTKRAPRRRVAHFDTPVGYGGGILGDTANGTKKADAEGYRWIDEDGHLTNDLHWVNGHGAPFNPAWMPAGKKFEDYAWSTLHKKHPALRDARTTFKDNAAAGLSTEWEVKDLHPLTTEAELTTAFKRLALDAAAAYGPHWRDHVQVKVLTNLAGGLVYAKRILRHANAVGFTTILLPRGKDRLRRINQPFISFNRGGLV